MEMYVRLSPVMAKNGLLFLLKSVLRRTHLNKLQLRHRRGSRDMGSDRPKPQASPVTLKEDMQKAKTGPGGGLPGCTACLLQPT